MTERPISKMMVRSKLLSEPDGPYAQHTGQEVMPTADQNGNLWVALTVGDGSGSGNNPFSLEAAFDQADNRPNFTQAGHQENSLAVSNHAFLFNGDATGNAAWDRARDAKATNLATQNGIGAALVAGVGEWSVNNTPAAATQATITKAAVAGTAHVCKSVSFSLNGTAAQPAALLNLRDGVSGAGTILWSMRVGPVLAGDSKHITLGGLNIVGTAGNAMTLEFAAAPAATNFQSVAMTGYDAN